jgi:hypothetical protein
MIFNPWDGGPRRRWPLDCGPLFTWDGGPRPSKFPSSGGPLPALAFGLWSLVFPWDGGPRPSKFPSSGGPRRGGLLNKAPSPGAGVRLHDANYDGRGPPSHARVSGDLCLLSPLQEPGSGSTTQITTGGVRRPTGPPSHAFALPQHSPRLRTPRLPAPPAPAGFLRGGTLPPADFP